MLCAPAIPYGGQAAIEGVMMKGKGYAALAVRRRDGRIEVLDRPVRTSFPWLVNLPVVRGAFILIDMLSIGVWALTESSRRFEEDFSEDGKEKAGGKDAGVQAEPATTKVDDAPQQGNAAPLSLSQILMLALSFLIAIAVFKLLPAVATTGIFSILGWATLKESTDPTFGQQLLANSIEGLIKFGIFVGYIWGVGRIPEIGRVFEYHGAEHIVINAYEDDPQRQDLPFIQSHPVAHPRCGTSFIAIMILLSILVFSLLDYWIVHSWPGLAVNHIPVWWLRWPLRIVGLIPLAGLSYEIIKAAFGCYTNPLLRPLLRFGMLFQALTVRRPSDAQVEVSLASFNRARYLSEGILPPSA